MNQSETRSFFSHGMAKWGLFMLALFALWFIGWFAIAGYADGKVTETLQKLDARGLKISCGDQDIRGFPFRLGIHCNSIDVADARSGLQATSGTLRTAAQLYAPGKMVGELDAPFELKANGQSVAANWTRLRVFLDASFDGGFDLASLNFSDLDALLKGQSLKVAEGALHLRPSPATEERQAKMALDVAADFKQIEQSGAIGAAFPKLSVYFDARLDDGYRDFVAMKMPLDRVLADGASGLVRSLTISVANGGKLVLNGPLQLDTDGLLSGEIQLGMANPKAVASAFEKFDPALKTFLLNLGNGLNALGKPVMFGEEEIKAVQLRIERGEIRLGFLKIGELGALRL